MKIEREKRDLMLLDQISQNNSSRSGNAVETMSQNSSIESLYMWKKLWSIRKIICEVVVLWMRGSWRELEIDKELREFIDAVRGEVQELSDARLLQAMEVIGIINWTNGDIICDQTLERREVRDDGWSSRKKPWHEHQGRWENEGCPAWAVQEGYLQWVGEDQLLRIKGKNNTHKVWMTLLHKQRAGLVLQSPFQWLSYSEVWEKELERPRSSECVGSYLMDHATQCRDRDRDRVDYWQRWESDRGQVSSKPLEKLYPMVLSSLCCTRSDFVNFGFNFDDGLQTSSHEFNRILCASLI
jgi:hypothetical protein